MLGRAGWTPIGRPAGAVRFIIITTLGIVYFTLDILQLPQLGWVDRRI